MLFTVEINTWALCGRAGMGVGSLLAFGASCEEKRVKIWLDTEGCQGFAVPHRPPGPRHERRPTWDFLIRRWETWLEGGAGRRDSPPCWWLQLPRQGASLGTGFVRFYRPFFQANTQILQGPEQQGDAQCATAVPSVQSEGCGFQEEGAGAVGRGRGEARHGPVRLEGGSCTPELLILALQS